MTVLHLSLLDLVGQNTATPVTATAGDWQHFQDLLKTALDQNATSEAAKPVAPNRAVSQAATAQADGNADAQAAAAQASAAQSDAVRSSAAQAKTAQANADRADTAQAAANQDKSDAATRHVEKRNAARADAAAADQKTSAQGSTAAPSNPTTVAGTSSPDASTAGTSSQVNPQATNQDAAATPAPSSDQTSGTVPVPDPSTVAAGPQLGTGPLDTTATGVPQPPVSTQTGDGAKADSKRSAATDPAAGSTAAVAAAAAATVAAALAPANPPPPRPAAITADGSQSSTVPGSVATGGLTDLLSVTTDPAFGGHPTVGASAPSQQDAKAVDSNSGDPATALFGAGGDATASLAAGLAPAPAAQSGNRSTGQGSSQQQTHSEPQSTSEQAQNSGSGDSQAAPVEQQVTPTPILTQPLAASSALLGASLTAAGSQRPDASATPGSEIDPAGTTTALGFGDHAAAASLAPLRLSETPSSTASPYAPTQAPLPVEQVALAIGRLTNGARSFSMQLNPEHLGAVDVRMEVDAKGKAKVAITAERPETLALLKLDSHHLVKALQDSGVSADQTSLSFSLREQGSNAAGDRRNGGSQGGRSAGRTSADDTQDTEATPVRMSLSRHLYDIHA